MLIGRGGVAGAGRGGGGGTLFNSKLLSIKRPAAKTESFFCFIAAN